MELKYCFILLFVISGIDGITFKIGVMIDNDTSRTDLPSIVAVNHQFDYEADIASHDFFSNLSDYTVEIFWEPMSYWTLFEAVKVGRNLGAKGVVAVFKVATESNYYLTPDWLIPISGVGNNQQVQEAHQENNYPREMNIFDLPTDDRMIGARELYSNILMSLLIKLDRSDAVLVYDQETEFISTGIAEKMRTNAIFLTMYKLDDSYDDEKINQFLEYIYNISKSELMIITVCSSSMMRRFMTQANLFDERFPRETSMFFISRWLVLNINDEPLEDVTIFSNLNNVAIINLPLHTLRLDVPEYMTLQYILHKVDIENKTDGNVMGDNSSFALLQEEIYNVSRQIRKDHFNSIRFTIKTLMFQKSGRQWATIGDTSLSGDVKLHSWFFPNQQFGFNGKLFVISTLEYFPFEYIENGVWKGFCIELLNEFSRKLNFTYYLTSPADGQWGTLVDESSWTGLVGQLQRKEVDLTFSPLVITRMREEVMDFTLGFFYEQTVILMKKLDPTETQWLRLIKPLRWEVILLTSCLIPVISLMVYVLEKVNPFYLDRHSRPSLHDAFWYTYGCLFNQGGQQLPRSQTGRTIICCWWLFCIMLSAIYSGNLIAFLTVTKEKLPFNTLHEMVNQDDYEWGTLGGTFWVTWFQFGTTPIIKSIWSGIVSANQSDPRVLSIKVSTHAEKLKEGRYAYIAEQSQIEIIAADDCDLHIAKDEFIPMQYGIGLPDKSPYTKIFSDLILGIHESGLMQIWKHKYWPKKNFCADSLITEGKPIELIDIQMAFLLSGIGFILGIFMLATELSCSKYKNRTKTSSRQESVQSNGTILSTM